MNEGYDLFAIISKFRTSGKIATVRPFGSGHINDTYLVSPLDGDVSEFISVARRKGSDWYAGAMTNWIERQLTMNLYFLDKGRRYEAEIFTDGVNANRIGSDYTLVKQVVKNGDKLKIGMAKGGGWVAHFKLLK